MGLQYRVEQVRTNGTKREHAGSSTLVRIPMVHASGTPSRLRVNMQASDHSEASLWIVDAMAEHPILGSSAPTPSHLPMAATCSGSLEYVITLMPTVSPDSTVVFGWQGVRATGGPETRSRLTWATRPVKRDSKYSPSRTGR
jgi:hypothetical protein